MELGADEAAAISHKNAVGNGPMHFEEGLWNSLFSSADHGRSEPKKSTCCLDNAVRKATVAARNQVLRNFECSNDPDHHQKDRKSVFGIAEAKANADHREGRKPFQIGGSARDGPKADRREGEHSDGQHKHPCGPPEEDLDCHGGRFNPGPGFGNVSFVLLTLCVTKLPRNSQNGLFDKEAVGPYGRAF
jgi:hypothetical protein